MSNYEPYYPDDMLIRVAYAGITAMEDSYPGLKCGLDFYLALLQHDPTKKLVAASANALDPLLSNFLFIN